MRYRRRILLLCLLQHRQSAALNLSTSRKNSYPSFHYRGRGAALSSLTPSAGSYLSKQSMLYTHKMDSRSEIEWSGPTGDIGSLERLCSISLRACQLMNPLISAIYEQLLESLNNSSEDDTYGKSSSVKKAKSDSSAFTIADGLVQRLLTEVLYANVGFRDIVGEEDEYGKKEPDCDSWFVVQGLDVPMNLRSLVECTKSDIESLAEEYLSTTSNDNNYKHLTVFIDPIDGTKEFSTGQGHHSSVCIGFANEEGKSVGGVVYRPLSLPNPTWVAGANSEGYAVCEFGETGGSVNRQNEKSALLTTNGSISLFLESLLEELKIPRVKSGGAGNKMMMLLERSIITGNNDVDNSLLYIQDRGVSRWDTCAAAACLEAFGGTLTKMTPYLADGPVDDHKDEIMYTYLASQTNLDFIPGKANLTKYNCQSSVQDLQSNQKAIDASQVKPYSNLCGLVALGKEWNTKEGKIQIQKAIQRAAMKTPPSLD